jgi:hypothetical protein
MNFETITHPCGPKDLAPLKRRAAGWCEAGPRATRGEKSNQSSNAKLIG